MNHHYTFVINLFSHLLMLISGIPAEYCPSDCGISKIYNSQFEPEQNKQVYISDIWPEAWI